MTTDPRLNLPAPGDDPADRDPSQYRERIERLADEAETARAGFDPPGTVPDEERALSCCLAMGEVVAVYLEAHAGDGWTAFSADELAALDRATGQYLELYAACHGVAFDARVSVREAATLLLDTHDLTDVARALTGVPE